MRVKVAAVALAMFSLTGFSPPARPPIDAQQVIPKSWIPEKPLEQKEPEQETPKQPEITVNVTPKTPSAYRHPTAVDCPKTDGGPAKSTRGFVESYTAAKAALDTGRYSDAISSAEIAAGYARTGGEWMAIEGMRIIAFARLQNDVELIASVEAALATGCLSPIQTANYRELLDGARLRLASPPQ